MRYRKHTSSRLRQKLTLQEEVQTPDGAGGYVRSWSDVTQLWAEIEPISGKEKLVGMQLESSVTHRVTLRFYPNVTAHQRLIYDDRILHIKYVATVRKEELLELLVEETA